MALSAVHTSILTPLVRRPFARVATPLFLLALVCCGATTATSGDGGRGTNGDGGAPDGPAVCPDKPSGTPTGRPTAGTCAPSNVPPPTGGDGGLTACTTDSDCGTGSLYQWCHGGKCQPDQCFSDTDCPSGQACACANEQIGNAEHTNACVMAQCRLDADCAGGQACSPTNQDLCSGGGPFFACHSSADSCRVDADCCPSAPSCRYQQTVGHWACVPMCTVNG